MLRADTGNYNRFLTSLGLALLAASALILYFFFHSTETLLVPLKTLNTLTPTGQDALEARQHALVTLEPLVICISILFALIGIGFLVRGGTRLRLAQVSDEEEGELRKTRARAEIRQLSPEQLADKHDQEARETITAPPDPPFPLPAIADEIDPAEQQAEKGLTRNAGDVRYRERRDAITRIEEEISNVLGTADFPNHSFYPNVEVFSRRLQSLLELDGLFEATDSDADRDVVLEVKLWPGPASLHHVLRYPNAILATVAKYQVMTARPAVGWLLIVISRDYWNLEGVAGMEERLAGIASPAATVSLIREEDLPELYKRFRDLATSMPIKLP